MTPDYATDAKNSICIAFEGHVKNSHVGDDDTDEHEEFNAVKKRDEDFCNI